MSVVSTSLGVCINSSNAPVSSGLSETAPAFALNMSVSECASSLAPDSP